MNHHLNPAKTGLVVGKLLATVHLVWAILVAFGWAQGLVNFSQWAHMVSMSLVVGPFDLTAAITVIVVAGLVGYAIGFVFAKYWNWIHK